MAGLSAFAEVAREQNPELVGRVTNDPLAPVLAIQAELNRSPTRVSGPDVGPVARASLMAQPINNPALRLLALKSVVDGQPRLGSRYAALSENVSRRDLLTELFLIEQSVQANDVPLALRHYDTALQTSEAARDILFPILGSAISNQDIREALAPYFAARRTWAIGFLQYAALGGGGTSPVATAQLLLIPSLARQTTLFRANGAALISGLLDQRQFPLALQIFSRLPGANPATLADASFTGRTTDSTFGRLSWATVDGGGAIAASFEAGSGNDARTLRVVANPSDRGAALRRVVMLPAGRYFLSERRSLVSGDTSSRAIWEMKCLSSTGNEPFWRGPSDAPAYNVSHAAGPEIPAGCPFQELVLNISGGEGEQGLELLIPDFRLTR